MNAIQSITNATRWGLSLPPAKLAFAASTLFTVGSLCALYRTRKNYHLPYNEHQGRDAFRDNLNYNGAILATLISTAAMVVSAPLPAAIFRPVKLAYAASTLLTIGGACAVYKVERDDKQESVIGQVAVIAMLAGFAGLIGSAATGAYKIARTYKIVRR